MRHKLLALACGLTLCAYSSSHGQAQVAMDASGMGLVILGYDGRACDSSIEGAIRYYSGGSAMQVCRFSGASSCPNVGDTCSDGTVFAGTSPDGNVDMYTTAADASSNYRWNDGSSNWVDTAVVNCSTSETGCVSGASNTSILNSLSGSPAPYQAADYCADLAENGHTDWYLPARDELLELYSHRNTGDLSGTFDTTSGGYASTYWSSSEASNQYVRQVRFDNGSVLTNQKNLNVNVRCVRKSNIQPMSYSWTNWGE